MGAGADGFGGSGAFIAVFGAVNALPVGLRSDGAGSARVTRSFGRGPVDVDGVTNNCERGRLGPGTRKAPE